MLAATTQLTTYVPPGSARGHGPVELVVARRPDALASIGWDECPGASPFLSARWLAAFAAAGGPATQYLLFRDRAGVLGKALEQRLPVARMRLGRVPSGLVSAVFGPELRQFGQALFSGPHGAHFADSGRGLELLEAARAARAERRGPASWLVKDLPIGPAQLPGWTSITALPDMTVPIDRAWSSEADYLAALPSKYRRRARRARRLFASLSVRKLAAHEADELSPDLDALYGDLLRRSPYVPWRAPAGYVARLRRAGGDGCELRGYFDGEVLVGFSTLLFAGGEALAHLAAVDEGYNASHQLYLNLLFDLLAAAIAGGAERLSLGRTATTIKSSLGARPAELVSYATHDGRLRRRLFGALNAGALSSGDLGAPVRRPFG